MPAQEGEQELLEMCFNLLCVRWTPDLKTGWEYRPLVRTLDNLDSNTWHSDDGSLRIEYLRDVEKVTELFRDIKDVEMK